jgi:hypothetical protein
MKKDGREEKALSRAATEGHSLRLVSGVSEKLTGLEAKKLLTIARSAKVKTVCTSDAGTFCSRKDCDRRLKASRLLSFTSTLAASFKRDEKEEVAIADFSSLGNCYPAIKNAISSSAAQLLYR